MLLDTIGFIKMTQAEKALKPQDHQPNQNQHVLDGYLRLWNIIGDKKQNIPALLPISRTSFLNGVKSGKYPKPFKLGERTVAWKVQDIHDLLNQIAGAA